MPAERFGRRGTRRMLTIENVQLFGFQAAIRTGVFSYCPNCGAKMDGDENG